jgi:N-acetylneuraminic acid mutarotase
MRTIPINLLAALLLLTGDSMAQRGSSLNWSQLPPLPDPEGFAGAFAGVCDGQLVVAGGTNFPDKKPWEGGNKVWYDTIFALNDPRGEWRQAGKLPRPNGYGVSITTPEGVICIGGGDAAENFRSAFRLRLDGREVRVEPLPPLPKPCAFMAGAQLGSTLFVAGGIETPASTEALGECWALDLTQMERGWAQLPKWPGPERILPCMASHEGAIYLFSGARLTPGPDGKAVREWLRDAYRYRPNNGWEKISDLPRVAVAAPSPAPVRFGKLLVLGGDDGALVNFEPKAKHPGFPRDVLSYDPAANAWTTSGELPFSLVTSPAVAWQGRVVIPGGEARPGKRSPQVWQSEE